MIFLNLLASLFTLLLLSTATFAQVTPEVAAEGAQTQPAEAARSETAKPESTTPESTPPPAPEPFQLPAEQHLWARFQPTAWREMQTVTETFDEAGKVVSRNVTTQKEILQAVAEDKYVLKVQATVDLGGKRIVGDWKDRVLHLATDGVGKITDSYRIVDQAFSLAGLKVECQVFEIRYSDGARSLTDRIHYNPQRFPFVLQRETLASNDHAEDGQQKTTAKNERLMEVMAQEVPFLRGKQLLDCCCLRTIRHRAKGNTVRLAFLNPTVPGGEVAVWSTDFDAQGKRVRVSVTTLLAYGETSPEDSDSP